MAEEKTEDDGATGVITYVDPAQLKADVDFDMTDLDSAMARHAGLVVHYGVQAVRARNQFERWKLKVEIIEAALDKSIRAKAKEDGEKLTEAGIKAQIVTDARWRKVNADCVEAQSQWKFADVAVKGMESRETMLKQVAMTQAREAGGQLRVAQNQSNRDRMLELMKKATAA